MPLTAVLTQIVFTANLRPACFWLTHTIKQGDAEQTRAAVSINQHLPAQEQRASREARGRINRATEGAQRVALANTCGTLQVEIKKILNLLQQMWVSKALHIKQHWWGTAAKQLFLKGCSKKKGPFILPWGWDTSQHNAQPKEVPAILRVCGQDGG